MASTSLLPKTISSFLSNPPSLASTHFTTKPSFFNPPAADYPSCIRKNGSLTLYAKKKNPFDIFDDGEDPDMEYGSLFVDGKQEEETRPPDNPNNPYGFLKFPSGFNVEVSPLGLKVRGDVRRCCCVISGGVYENLLFFPVIQLLKDRYPGVLVDVLASARGKQCYELNKNVRWANVYDPDDDFPEPADYTDMIGVLKNRYYDMMLSTKLAGLGHAAFLFMSSARDKVSYIYPNVNAAGAGLMLTETFTPDSLNLSEGGYHMYHQMVDWLGRPLYNVPRQPVPPLRVSLSRKLKEYVEAKYRAAGADRGKYIVIHGIESDSKASMQSRGDTDSLLPLEVWNQIAEGIRYGYAQTKFSIIGVLKMKESRLIQSHLANSGLKPVFVIPHEKERDNVEEIVDVDDFSIVFITTPGQLAALINDSAGVIATNTAAIQLANAREKPSIALFGSEEKGKLFVPNAEEKKCAIVSSKTGKLKDVDVEDVKQAMPIFDVSLALV